MFALILVNSKGFVLIKKKHIYQKKFDVLWSIKDKAKEELINYTNNMKSCFPFYVPNRRTDRCSFGFIVKL